jgi:restriction system protein
MATRRKNKRQHRELKKILNAGITALVLSLAFFMAPSFLEKSGNWKGLGVGLGNFALPALGGGLLLIGVYLALKQFGQKHVTKPESMQKMALFKREPVLKPMKSADIPVLKDAVQVPPASSSWSPAVFAAIEWRRFEAVCEALFAQAGCWNAPPTRQASCFGVAATTRDAGPH